MSDVAEGPDEVVTEFGGIPVTRAGKARAKATLQAAQDRFDPVAREALKVRLGLRSHTAAAEQPARHAGGETLADLVAAAGIVVTPEGRARARRKLDDAAARMTPEKRAALRDRFGRPSRPARPAATVGGMEQPASHATDKPGTALLEAAGMTSTPEGRASARRRLAEGRARLTPEALADIRAQIGAAPRTA